MPREPSVPYTPFPTAQAEGVNAGQMTARPTPEAFGGATAAATQKLGAAGQEVGQQENALAMHLGEIYNDSTSRDAVVNSSQKLGDLLNQYKSNRGNNAVNAYKDFQTATTKLYEDTANNMPTNGSQKMFRDQFSREVAYTLKDAGGYAANQGQEAYVKSIDASIGNNQNLLASTANDPERRKQLVDDIHNNSLTLSHTLGESPEVAYQNLSKNVGAGYASLIKQNIVTNPEQAKSLYQEAVNGTFSAESPDGKTVQVPYMDAAQRSQVAAEMGTEFRRQATETLKTAHDYAMAAKPYDRQGVVTSLLNAGFDEKYARAEVGRLDALSGSSDQRNLDYGAASKGVPIVNNVPMVQKSTVDLIDKYATANGVPLDVAHAIAVQESGMNPNVKPGDGGKAIGTFQLHEGAAKDVGLKPEDRFDQEKNIEGGAKYLKQLYDKFGSWDKAMAAFNAGPTALSAVGGDVTKLPKSSQDYLASVSALRRSSPQSLIDRAEGNPQTQYQIAQNLTALTPLTDDAVTIGKSSGPAQQILQQAAMAKSTLLKNDAAGYLQSVNPALTADLTQGLKDPKAVSPDVPGPYGAAGTNYLDRAITETDNVYKSLNQPEDNRPVLPQAVAQQIVTNLPQDYTARLSSLESMEHGYGQHWDRIYGDLVTQGDLPKQDQIMMSVSDPEVRYKISQAYNTSEKEMEKAMGEQTAENDKGKTEKLKGVITTSVENNPKLNDYLKTLRASGASDSDIAGYRDVVKRLAYQNSISGDGAQDAANNAVSAITKNYQIYGHARIPAAVAPNVITAADVFKDNISENTVSIPENYADKATYIHDIKYGSEWITNNKETGLNLKDPTGRPVRDRMGNILTIPFTVQLNAEARAKALTEEQERNAAPFGSTAAVAGM